MRGRVKGAERSVVDIAILVGEGRGLIGVVLLESGGEG